MIIIRIELKLSIIILLANQIVFFYRPRLVFEKELSLRNAEVIKYPEIAQTYYGELSDKPDFYKIISEKNFDLYFKIMVPDIPDARTDFTVEIYGENKNIILDGAHYEWEESYERLTGNNYLVGPSYEETLEKGEYLMQVYNGDNQGKYLLVIGRNKTFSLIDAINTIWLMPKIKTFMERSILSAYFNQIGIILFTLLLAVILFISIIILYCQYRAMTKYERM